MYPNCCGELVVVKHSSRPSLLDHPLFWYLGIGPAALGYGILVGCIGHLRAEHYPILGIFILLCYVPGARSALKLLLPFFLFGFLYDSLRFITPIIHARVPIHVAQPYLLEKAIFGIQLESGAVVTPTEFFQTHTHPVMDLVSAVAYLLYILVPFGLAFILLAKDRATLERFGWAFLVVNLMGFATYYLYPAAPPWYVEQHGLGPAILDAAPHPARLAAVDSLLNTSTFQSIYSRSANVFAALPSLHVAYPLVAWLYARKVFTRFHWLFGAFWLTVCCAAVYLRHHYVIDVLLGVSYAALTYISIEMTWRFRRSRRVSALATAARPGSQLGQHT
ncbi:MAG: inositol phosphorylceramide synthase [Bradymonadales bacterium]|nr:inositol phosphorylceramide synthase [Bradymonadales bacterium]